MTALYVSSRTRHAARWQHLREQGAPIIATWIDAERVHGPRAQADLWGRILDEITRCSAFVLYGTPEDFPLRGALVEVGMALTLHKPIYVALPGVRIEAATNRPVGSWINASNVTICATLEDALAQATRSLGLRILTRPEHRHAKCYCQPGRCERPSACVSPSKAAAPFQCRRRDDDRKQPGEL